MWHDTPVGCPHQYADVFAMTCRDERPFKMWKVIAGFRMEEGDEKRGNVLTWFVFWAGIYYIQVSNWLGLWHCDCWKRMVHAWLREWVYWVLREREREMWWWWLWCVCVCVCACACVCVRLCVRTCVRSSCSLSPLTRDYSVFCQLKLLHGELILQKWSGGREGKGLQAPGTWLVIWMARLMIVCPNRHYTMALWPMWPNTVVRLLVQLAMVSDWLTLWR